MSAPRTARDRARAELTHEIKEAARRQLITGGAEQLSLRAVARELGMVSSALYRYYPSRDELLTALIIDAYEALGDVAEKAAAAGNPRNYRARWRAVCRAIRDWAVENPQEYALIYGSPVAGYNAPQSTVDPASRIPLALIGIAREAHAANHLGTPYGPVMMSATLRKQLHALAEFVEAGLPVEILGRLIIAWTQLFGMISFELFGHLKGSVDPSRPFFDFATDQMADYLGLEGP
ncbi:TetR/AcrR family transcriptional regulator [Kribbella deserti]|uniref:TetR/AcrR family transcriptional regulator n=1 Tax=Kribbella deserti TaxID=1926257 RepID=A0ABV6QU51_9ACTN